MTRLENHVRAGVVERLRHVSEDQDNEAGRTEEQKLRCCRTSAHATEKHRFTQTINAQCHRVDVRFGSLADIMTSPPRVRFTPNNGRWAAHPREHLAIGL
jgi:hypothetical protein